MSITSSFKGKNRKGSDSLIKHHLKFSENCRRKECFSCTRISFDIFHHIHFCCSMDSVHSSLLTTYTDDRTSNYSIRLHSCHILNIFGNSHYLRSISAGNTPYPADLTMVSNNSCNIYYDSIFCSLHLCSRSNMTVLHIFYLLAENHWCCICHLFHFENLLYHCQTSLSRGLVTHWAHLNADMLILYKTLVEWWLCWTQQQPEWSIEQEL